MTKHVARAIAESVQIDLLAESRDLGLEFGDEATARLLASLAAQTHRDGDAEIDVRRCFVEAGHGIGEFLTDPRFERLIGASRWATIAAASIDSPFAR